ncbi:hypothetical protein SAY87_010101 [Trapa incisa]|uniref:Uncharacterized protein n=1 Tax=Trapa incisa TaxID=236973 RepID=A0AAN7GTM5_9MYRT|nr:hypothetical protein SAY87_010101 [Trapa incisa]
MGILKKVTKVKFCMYTAMDITYTDMNNKTSLTEALLVFPFGKSLITRRRSIVSSDQIKHGQGKEGRILPVATELCPWMEKKKRRRDDDEEEEEEEDDELNWELKFLSYTSPHR